MSELNKYVDGYLSAVISKVFKILPMRETNEPSLPVYLDSLCMELTGSVHVFSLLENDSEYITLIAIICSLRDNPETDTRVVKREVFHSISICNKLKEKYGTR